MCRNTFRLGEETHRLSLIRSSTSSFPEEDDFLCVTKVLVPKKYKVGYRFLQITGTCETTLSITPYGLFGEAKYHLCDSLKKRDEYVIHHHSGVITIKIAMVNGTEMDGWYVNILMFTFQDAGYFDGCDENSTECPTGRCINYELYQEFRSHWYCKDSLTLGSLFEILLLCMFIGMYVATLAFFVCMFRIYFCKLGL